MYPGYRFMPSYPQHSSHMPCTPQYGLGFEAVPPQMKVDPAGYPINFESWPYGGSHGYPHPAECHACCHYNQFPGYHGYRPPHPHFAPPPSVYSHGSYPAFPATYPVHCVPSPHCSVENPRYEYDKHDPRDPHCCGCPNHLHQQKEDGNVKIEEHDPDDEKTLNDSLVPSQLKNLPYPIVWILPPGYMMNKEGKITDGPKSREGDKYGRDEKANGSLKSFEQEPSVWNRWLLIDLNNLGSLNQGGDGKRTQPKQNEDMSRNSFPIFWMPHKPEQEVRKEMNGDQKSSEEPLYLRIPPMKFIDSDDRKSQPEAHEENSDTEAGLNLVGKNVVPQMIPVNQKEPSDKTTILKDVKQEDTIIPVEHKDDKAERGPADGSAKTQSSPPKKSKLPPVCLRVDPLPRRKNNNGGSRSPSPANKGKSQELLHGSSKSGPSSFMKENSKEDMQSPFHLDKSKEGEQSKIKTKTIEVVDGAIRKDKREDLKEAQTQASVSLPVDCHEKVPMSETDRQGEKGDRECSFEGDKFESNADDKRSGELTEDEKRTVEGQSANGRCETGVDGGATNVKESKVNDINREIQRKKLSEAEAAVIIQSAYRGFEVRRWEPLKKLKEIAKINEPVTEVRGRVQDLVSSYEFSSNDKQRVVIGETIMSLLLKLDTIQGFNPSVRDIRKSVAKELVSLQEKLDSLTTKKSEASMEKASEAEHVEGISSSTSDDACTQGKQVSKDEQDHKISGGSHDVKSDLAEPCQGQSLPVTDVNFSSVAAEKSEPMLSNKEAYGDLEEKFSKPDVPSSVDSSYSDPLNEPKETQINEVADIGQVPILRPSEDYDVLKVEVDKLPLPNVAEDEFNSSVELTDLYSPVDSVTGKNKDMNDFQELPQGVLNQEPDAQETSKGEVVEINQAEKQVEELLNECPDASKHNNNIVPEGAGEKDEEHFGEAIFGSDLEIAKVEDVSDTNQSPEVYEVEGLKVTSVEDMGTVDNAGLEKNEFPAVAQEIEKNEPELSVLEYDICEDKSKESHGAKNADDNTSESKNITMVCEERELPMKEAIQHCVDQNIEAAEEQEMLEEKAKPNEFQPMTSSTNIDDLPCQNAEKRVLLAEELVPPCAEQAGEKLSALPLTSDHVSHDTEMGYDRKLIEENEKLKEMMEKLVEAGKEQLTAISNLSGRVKDLEKKLSRKKKLKMRRRYSKFVS